MTCRNFSLQKGNGCKVQLRFVKCSTLVVTEGYHILLSPLKISHVPLYYVKDVYHKNQLGT